MADELQPTNVEMTITTTNRELIESILDLINDSEIPCQTKGNKEFNEFMDVYSERIIIDDIPDDEINENARAD